MGALSKWLRSVQGGVAFWCPGCDGAHIVFLPRWSWNGNTERPTFSPSLLLTSPGYCCHTITNDGIIQFCGDCTHALAGQSVAMIDWPQEHENYGGTNRIEASPSA